MEDKFLAYIAEKRAKIAKQRAKLDVAEAALDQSEKHYLASGASRLHKPAQKTPQDGRDALTEILKGATKALGAIAYSFPPNPTIKERVVAILKKHPDGLTSAQILSILQATGLPNIWRETLSPQLSRLKKYDHVLDAKEGVWFLKNKNGGADADSSA